MIDDNDLTTRLRWVARNADQPICEEAADEIERLRNLLTDIRSKVRNALSSLGDEQEDKSGA